MKTAVKLTPEHPVLTDRYLVGREIEVDAISDGETVIIPGIMEHIEKSRGSLRRLYSCVSTSKH